MVVAGDVLHVDTLQAVEVDLVARHEVEQMIQRDGAFQAGQRCPEATVDAVAEAEILRLRAIAGRDTTAAVCFLKRRGSNWPGLCRWGARCL